MFTELGYVDKIYPKVEKKIDSKGDLRTGKVNGYENLL